MFDLDKVGKILFIFQILAISLNDSRRLAPKLNDFDYTYFAAGETEFDICDKISSQKLVSNFSRCQLYRKLPENPNEN